METAVAILDAATRAAASAFDPLPRLAALIAYSLICGVTIAWIAGKTTKKSAVARARDRLSASLYEARLFFDQPRLLILAQLRALRWTAGYLFATLPALLVAGPLLVLLSAKLEARFAFAPLPLDRPAVVTIMLDPRVEPAFRVEEGGGVRVTAPPVRERGWIHLRVEPTEPNAVLSFFVGEARFEKKLTADRDAPAVSVSRSQGFDALFEPSLEPPLPDRGGVRRIEVFHEERTQRFAPWWAIFLVLSILAAWAVRRPLGVEL
jgi:hypothetical protein